MSDPRRNPLDFNWTEQAVAKLTALWAEGLTCSKIADRMGLNGNQIIGKVHRLGLPPRTSPIRKAGAPRPPRPERVRGATLPGVNAAPPKPQDRKLAIRLVAPVREPTPVFRGRKSEPCCYPIGHPGQAGFRYCDEPSLPGKPMCETHHALCYVPAKPASLRNQEQRR